MSDAPLKECLACNGLGKYSLSPIGGWETCSRCNGKGQESRWICKAGLHKSVAFDDIKNDPRLMPCKKCEGECPMCKGTGNMPPPFSRARCPACMGWGTKEAKNIIDNEKTVKILETNSNVDSMFLKRCQNCKGSGIYRDPVYDSSSPCTKCNGIGVEKKWICAAGKHKTLAFDDLENDPREMACSECLKTSGHSFQGFIEILREKDETLVNYLKAQVSKKTLPHLIEISYEEEMRAMEEEASEAYLGLTGKELAMAQGLDEFTAIKYSETKKGKLFFMVGLPRAGKTTLMNKWKSEGPNRVIICFDNIRLALYEKDHLQQMEPFLWEMGTTMMKTLLLSGYDVMMDDTHTSKWKRDYYKQLGGHGMYLNTPLDICVSRAPQNHASFIKAINRMAGRLENFDPKAEGIAVVDWKTQQEKR